VTKRLDTGWRATFNLVLFEHGSKDHKIRALRSSAVHFFRTVARDADDRCATALRLFPNIPDLGRRDIVGPQMNAVCADSKRDVSAGIDQEASRCSLVVSRSLFTNESDCLTGELFEFTSAEAFFAKLDVVYATEGSFGDFGEQRTATLRFAAGKLTAVGNVVEQTPGGHQPSAYYTVPAPPQRKSGSAGMNIGSGSGESLLFHDLHQRSGAAQEISIAARIVRCCNRVFADRK